MTYYLIDNTTGEITHEYDDFEIMLKKLYHMKVNGYNLQNYTLKNSFGRHVKASNIILD